jgi:multidrug efflux pump subunit AcrB
MNILWTSFSFSYSPARRYRLLVAGRPLPAAFIIGFSRLDGVFEPNSAFLVARLRPFADRKAAADSVQALIRSIYEDGAQLQQANVPPFNLPPIIGLSTSGGFEYQLEALEGQDPAAMGSVTSALIAAANRDPRLARVFTTFTATNPSIYLDNDRAKAQALGLNMSNVFTALQATLGGIYINNFNLYGRTWQVNIQGDAANRGDISDIWQIYVRNGTGEMVPIRSIASLKIVTGPQVITRYNNYRSVTVNGSPAAGVSSGTTLTAMTEISNATLPTGYTFEMDRHRLSGARSLGPDRHHPRACGAVRLFIPGRAL